MKTGELNNILTTLDTLDVISNTKNRANILGKTNAFKINIIEKASEKNVEDTTSNITRSSEYTYDDDWKNGPIIDVTDQTLAQALWSHPTNIDCTKPESIRFTNFFVRHGSQGSGSSLWYVETRNSYRATLKKLIDTDTKEVILTYALALLGFCPVNFGPQSFNGLEPSLLDIKKSSKHIRINGHWVDANGCCIDTGDMVLKTPRQVHDEAYG